MKYNAFLFSSFAGQFEFSERSKVKFVFTTILFGKKPKEGLFL